MVVYWTNLLNRRENIYIFIFIYCCITRAFNLKGTQETKNVKLWFRWRHFFLDQLEKSAIIYFWLGFHFNLVEKQLKINLILQENHTHLYTDKPNCLIKQVSNLFSYTKFASPAAGHSNLPLSLSLSTYICISN